MALIAHWQVIVTNPLVDIDYSIVLEPLKGVGSIYDYLELFSSGVIYDLQPVRDLSLKCDLLIENIFGFQVHGFFNVFFWTIAVFNVFCLLKRYYPLAHSFTLCCFCIVHPVLSWTLSWPSARKHILAAMFMTFAFRFLCDYVEKNKNSRLMFVSIILSLFSQPITIPYCIAIIIVLYYFKKNFFLIFAIVALTGFCAVGNHLYYDGLYITQTGLPKYAQFGEASFPIRIISFSRYLSQLFLPLEFASTYNLNSLINFFGIPFFGIFSYYFVLKKGIKPYFYFFLLLLAPILLTNLKLTNIFVADTYLLMSLVILTGALVYLEFPLKLMLIIIPLLAGKTIYEESFSTDLGLYYKQTYSREPNCLNTLNYSNYLFINSEIDSFYEVTKSLVNRKCQFKGIAPEKIAENSIGIFIFLNKELSVDEKLNLLKNFKTDNPNLLYLVKWLENPNISSRPKKPMESVIQYYLKINQSFQI